MRIMVRSGDTPRCWRGRRKRMSWGGTGLLMMVAWKLAPGASSEAVVEVTDESCV